MSAQAAVRFAGSLALLCASTAWAADTIKIAHIDPTSGPFAAQGEGISKHLQATIDEINASYGWNTDVRIEATDTVLRTTCKMEQPQ